MTNLNLNHFLVIIQDELCLKGTFVKVSFMFVTISLDFYEKNFTLSCRKHPKIIEIKDDIFSHFFVVP